MSGSAAIKTLTLSRQLAVIDCLQLTSACGFGGASRSIGSWLDLSVTVRVSDCKSVSFTCLYQLIAQDLLLRCAVPQADDSLSVVSNSVEPFLGIMFPWLVLILIVVGLQKKKKKPTTDDRKVKSCLVSLFTNDF